MYETLLLAGVVVTVCVLTNRVADKLPVPSLIVFIALGMICGSDGPAHIQFGDYALTEAACCSGLLFIMFYGGFNANVREARPVAAQAITLSTLGVLVCAGLVGAFCHFALGVGWLEGMLVGSVIASTDAASVFNVLRSAKLSLRDGTDSLLEIESGSNDPMAYMLTAILTAIILGRQVSVPLMVAEEVVIGLAFGVGIGRLAELALERVEFTMDQGETILLVGVAVISYALPSVLHGNGFLSVYLCGMWLGNADIPHKRAMAQTFDVITEICQMGIFFLLGLLVAPSRLPQVLVPALAVFAFITVVGRPLSTFVVLRPFGASMAKIGLTSWSGLRGAASVVFALYAVTAGVSMPAGAGGALAGAARTTLPFNLFDLVFVVVLLSLTVQGGLLPWVAKRLDMIDPNANVMRTFNDFQEESDLSLIKIKVDDEHPWAGRALRDVPTPRDLIVVLVLRHGNERVVPGGNTVLEKGDLLVYAAPTFEARDDFKLREVHMGEHHRWAGKLLRELPDTSRMVIVMLKRGDKSIIPNGDTRIEPGDLAFVAGTTTVAAAAPTR
ncbi:potassium/proton antiporter [uncultured Parolsenella sp.]|uniref:potassium/proton antiporter n=1 Tax=uncultured Parolsenella sp. TaxID=2083008 RepID=UPI0027D93EAF|nr:potassium/proton antiporter [uncultured Parolsenella sp.]